MESSSSSTSRRPAASSNAGEGEHDDLSSLRRRPRLLMAPSSGECWEHPRLQEILTGEQGEAEQVAAAAPPPRAHEVAIDVAASSSSGGEDAAAAAAQVLGAAITEDADSALHVVAAAGDGGRYLESAGVICGRAGRRLLSAGNGGGDTPLHRAGNTRMLARLIGLAAAQGDDGGVGGEAARDLVRMQNARGETALQEAVRFGDAEMVAALVRDGDGELARVVAGDGTSPLYLASMWGRHRMARVMHDSDPGLSYAAVLNDDRGELL